VRTPRFRRIAWLARPALGFATIFAAVSLGASVLGAALTALLEQPDD
jgi:hypothetical protein